MSTQDIQDLLNKYRTGTISAEELEVLETWYLQWQPDRPELQPQELESAKTSIWQSIQQQEYKSKRSWQWLPAVAAVAAVLIAALYLYFPRELISRGRVAAERSLTDFKPGGNKAVLTLSNGQQIVLDQSTDNKLASQGTIEISQTAGGELVYHQVKPQKDHHPENMSNTMSTPRGGQYQLVLSDGTRVWLNAASSITYPVVFSGKTRAVSITGEAYFEIAHNKKMPFIVSSANQEITVLGTHFNVCAYSDDPATITALVSGSIHIRNLNSGASKTLTPGQGARISPSDKDIEIYAVNTDESISWKNGYFIFDNQDIGSIMKILGRWYDVDIECRTANSLERFGGSFSRNKNLIETLKNLEKVGKMHFKSEQGKILVTD